MVRPVLRLMQNLCRPGPMEAVRILRTNWEEIPLSCLREVGDGPEEPAPRAGIPVNLDGPAEPRPSRCATASGWQEWR